MTLHDVIARELANAFAWGKASAESGTLTTPQQVVESGVEQILRQIKFRLDAHMYNEITAGENLPRKVGDIKHEAAFEAIKAFREELGVADHE